ncbi:MAG: hypothetical protein JST53_16580 [Actinobacteria bacterium]|nr:hypothetical protein [Actinomycetota bacterium]
MTSFKWALLGYRRREVDAAMAAHDTHIMSLEQHAVSLGERNSSLEAQGLIQARAIASHESDLSSLSAMVVERERTIRDLTERLEEANAVHDRSIASLDAVSARLEELQAQARGQATRIRMKALREAVEVSKRVQEVSEAEAEEVVAPDVAPAAPETVIAVRSDGNANGYGNGHVEVDPGTAWEPGLFEGKLRLEIGPLGDFSQLVGFEETVGKIGATDISVERFSEGRATFSMNLHEPVDLLRELEALSTIEFKVRHTAPDNLILDVDEDGPERHAA